MGKHGKKSNEYDELAILYRYDELKFRHSFAKDIRTANQRQLAAKLIFTAHSLEKGLSNDKFEIGHGFDRSKKLIEVLRQYKLKSYDQGHLAYVSTLSVLKEFYSRHENTTYQSGIEAIFGEFFDEIQKCNSTIGGADVINYEEKISNDKKNFRNLAMGRYSVRTYSKKSVNKKDIIDAVNIAMKTPTVCNRQSLHVHYMTDRAVIQKVLEVQGGITKYETPPSLLLVTADDNGYVGSNERNQGFIDGGLFAMSLLYALEYKKLAACPLHAMFNELKEKTIRGMLGIPENEKLITFISVGHFKKENSVCKSFRYPAEYIMDEKDQLHDFKININNSRNNSSINYKNNLAKLRRKIRPRARTKVLMRSIKHKTRIRTRWREFNSYRQLRKDDKQREIIRKMPRGAILTLTDYRNYGNILQRYALQKFLANNGYNLISYAREPFETNNRQFERFRNTINFVQQRIPRKAPDKRDNYNIFITGSDQVWRKWGPIEGDEKLESVKYYLFNDINNKKAKLIAYAASFGQDNIEDARLSDEFMSSSRKLAHNMSAISMREDSGIEIVKKYWGLDAKLVVDPTMLLKSKVYDSLISNSTCKLEKSKPLFIYILDESKSRENDIKELLKDYKKPFELIYLYKMKKLIPVEQWLKNIRDAELVITDSFHGIVLAIIFNTPFLALERPLGGISRISGLLKKLGLEDRLIPNDAISSSTIDQIKTIDWSRVNKKVNILRKDSADWLKDKVRS